MVFSDHFKNTLRLLGLGILGLVAAFFYLKHRIYDVIVPKQLVLLTKDRETIVYNENRHDLEVTTPSGTKHYYSRDPEVEIRKDGTVKVDAHAYGFEVRPMLGIGYSDTARVYAGCDLLYWHSLDAGASFGWTADNRRNAFQPMLSLGYNVWSNTSINLGVNPLTIAGLSKPEPAIFLSVRL